MTILTPTEIQTEAERIIDNCSVLYPNYLKHFELMYRYGLRVSEVVQKTGINKDAALNLVVYMPKTKRNRIIERDAFIDTIAPDEFLSINTVWNMNTIKVRRAYERLMGYSQLFVGDKDISTHFLRHAAVKRYFNAPHTLSETNIWLGEVAPYNTQGYVNSEIYY